MNDPGVLLVGPYDPHCGEYTFLAPPLGVWRLAGVLNAAGIRADVFDPNCCQGPPAEALKQKLRQDDWNVIGISTTGMTLRYDLELAHIARQVCPDALVLAGGMEATFKPELMFELGPFDLVVLGEGEKPLLEIVSRLRRGAPLDSVPGTARFENGQTTRFPQGALNADELRDAILKTPYEKMPYTAYWERLESAYNVRALPFKADREARLAEIRSVRLITLNYCPMGCTFCSSTNFLHNSQGSLASIARLNVENCMTMIRRIVAAQPTVRTIIFQDDIFVFTQDHRVLPLCEAIIAAKKSGDLPEHLQFISTNRIDAMNAERLQAMRRAGFRVLGFGVENFSLGVLKEFNKSRIFPYIEPMLQQSLENGITPFLDMILTSPRCKLEDLSETVRKGYQWLLAGCEIGMYPYVIPFSGAAMAGDPELTPHITFTRQHIRGTAIYWDQPSKILPLDSTVREAILEIEQEFNRWIEYLQPRTMHLPSRTRSLIWVMAAAQTLRQLGMESPDPAEVLDQLILRLPGVEGLESKKMHVFACQEELETSRVA